jgi:predicted dehydrogenase
MNAGYQPADHWTHQDGGRIIGEACHIIDLMGALTNSRITGIQAENTDHRKGKFFPNDNKSILLKYEDGSLATIEYISMGSRSMPKEYMEIHFDEMSIILDDYKQLKSFGLKMNTMTSKVSQKGHFEELGQLHEYLSGRTTEAPLQIWNILQTTRTAITLGEIV